MKTCEVCRKCEACRKEFAVEPEFDCINLCYKHFPSTWGRVWDKIKRFCNWLRGKENKPSIFYGLEGIKISFEGE
jgi:hypothetical protein